MKKFNLKMYKTNNRYFLLFDIYLKDTNINKEVLLKEIGIAPSSYRKCRRGELNIGDKIIEQLSIHFNMKTVDDAILSELEEIFNTIYYDLYYKINDNYDYYLAKINYYKSLNYNIFPIIDLFLLFIMMNSDKDSNLVREENHELFKKLKKYHLFFADELEELYEIVCLFYEEEITGNLWLKNYNDACAYHLLMSRSYRQKRYIESLFFGNKAKELLNLDGNIKRALYINNVLMSSLIYVGNFEECYNVSFKQSLTLKSINIDNKFLNRSARKFKIISMLALNKYEDINKEYLKYDSLSIVEILCLMTSLYKEGLDNHDLTSYNEFYSQFDLTDNEQEDNLLIINLNEYLTSKKKHSLRLFAHKKFDLFLHLENIVKNIVN